MSSGRRLTAFEVARIIGCYEDGLSIAEVAAETGRHEATVFRTLRRVGVKMRPQGGRPGGVRPQRPPRWPAAIERLLARVRIDGDCWMWTGTRAGRGKNFYGQFTVGGNHVQVHRFAFEHWLGPIPAGHHVIRTCEQNFCINPDHLTTAGGAFGHWDNTNWRMTSVVDSHDDRVVDELARILGVAA